MRIRCDHGGVVGLITNRHFCNLDWAQQVGRKLALGLLEKDGDARGLLDIAPSDARDLLLPAVPQIVKSQRSTGLWRIKNACGISLSLLKAMKHAELLKTVLPQLRHDPYQPFLDAEDWHGIAARHQLLKCVHPKERR